MQPVSEMGTTQLRLLEQITESLNHLNSRMETSESISRHMLERMVVLEVNSNNIAKMEQHVAKVEGNLTTRINGHSDRIASLEASRHRLEGASGVVDVLNKAWPIFAAIFGAVGIYFGFA